MMTLFISVILTSDKKIDRTLFDFDIKLGDRIDVYQDGDLTVVTPAEVQTDLSLEGDKSVKSHLLQGILDLFSLKPLIFTIIIWVT